jgi:AcrR family transcriptional regulator
MSPRPRTVSDEAILAAAGRAMSRLGPTKLTLAEVAREAGVSAATLVQRFGSKRGLLLAASRGLAEYMDDCFVQLRSRHRSPLAAVVAAATDLARNTASPDEMANHLAALQIDVGDPDFRKPMHDMSIKMLAGYKALLDEAVKAGELRRCDTAALSRTIGAVSGGSLISWAVFREGTAEQWVRADLDTLLAPYRVAPSPGGRRRKA